jgi:hypothetical protein
MSEYLNAIGIYAGAIFAVAITARKIRQWRWHKILRERAAQAGQTVRRTDTVGAR